MKHNKIRKYLQISLVLNLLLISFQVGADEGSSTDCPQGQRFDTALNRCVSTESTLKNQAEYKACEELASEQRASCYEKAAKDQEKKTRNKYGDDVNSSDVTKGKTLQTIESGLFASLAVWQVFGASSWKSSCWSTKIFGATSLAGFVKNVAFEDDVEKDVKKMADEFNKEASEKDTMKDAQLTAFDYLEKEQNYLGKYAKDNKKLYQMLGLGYTASVAMAVYEAYQKGGAFTEPCSKSEESDTTADSGGEAGAGSDAKPTDQIKATETQPAGEAPAPSGISKIAGSVGDGLSYVSKFLDTPIGVIAAGGIAAVQSFALSSEMAKKAKEAESNVGMIQDLREKYMASISNYCPDGREDLSKPYCYCYTDKGAKNPNRTNSQTCQNLWKTPDSLWAESEDALRGSGLAAAKGCVYVDGKFDPGCQCKRMKNKSGENACMKINMPSGAFSGLGPMNIGAAVSGVESLNQGNSSSGAVESDLDAQAAIAKKAKSALLSKISPMVKKQTGKSVDEISNDILSKAKSAASESGNRVALYNPPSLRMAEIRPNTEALQSATASVKTIQPKLSSSKRRGSTKAKAKTNWNFDSSNNTSSVLSFSDVAQEGQVKYDYKNSDINTDKSASIWNVISKRYNQSGLRRLFDDGSEKLIIDEE
ncbi:hypothetical protein [Bacteriovorax sp. Seq25_V]|uniref:hypothetical protein n=1 Tax=Bacteriovorax sp. Seq25_V TaxID=1201288 RepID=UPI000389F57D|nr:hypothetical protein [Bacteriovorax sp. Seq25_V]EQC48021.1 hypothetical protein M900_1099 [Bacteriovorax sp. Seq25_V]